MEYEAGAYGDPLVLELDAGRLAGVAYARDAGAVGLDVAGFVQRVHDEHVARERRPVVSGDVRLRVLPVDEPAGVRDLDGVVVDVDLDDAARDSVAVREGVEEDLAHRILR